MRRALSLVLSGWLSVTAFGCTPQGPIDPAALEMLGRGIVGGSNTSDWPAVGMYLIDGGYGGLCTATLVAEDVLLTACHCVDGAGSQDAWSNASNMNDISWGNTWNIDEAIEHPSCNMNASHPHDMAVLILEDPITDFDFIPVNTTSFSNSWVGDWFHYVGYGNNTTYSGSGAGVKRETDIQLNQYETYEYIHYTYGTNTCAGDSGGPSLVDIGGDWYVAGVNSAVGPVEQGQDYCEGYGYEMRVDTEINFLDDYFDPGEMPAGDDDDDDNTDDDDDTDDDDNTDDDDDTYVPTAEDLPTPFIADDYDQAEGCVCSSSRASEMPGAALGLLVLGAAFIARRRS